MGHRGDSRVSGVPLTSGPVSGVSRLRPRSMERTCGSFTNSTSHSLRILIHLGAWPGAHEATELKIPTRSVLSLSLHTFRDWMLHHQGSRSFWLLGITSLLTHDGLCLIKGWVLSSILQAARITRVLFWGICPCRRRSAVPARLQLAEPPRSTPRSGTPRATSVPSRRQRRSKGSAGSKGRPGRAGRHVGQGRPSEPPPRGWAPALSFWGPRPSAPSPPRRLPPGVCPWVPPLGNSFRNACVGWIRGAVVKSYSGTRFLAPLLFRRVAWAWRGGHPRPQGQQQTPAS